MPKIKSNRAASKRFRSTASGIKRNKAYASHILTKKSAKCKRNLRQGAMVHSANLKSIKKLLPYL